MTGQVFQRHPDVLNCLHVRFGEVVGDYSATEKRKTKLARPSLLDPSCSSGPGPLPTHTPMASIRVGDVRQQGVIPCKMQKWKVATCEMPKGKVIMRRRLFRIICLGVGNIGLGVGLELG